jgi:hypothetical protein
MQARLAAEHGKRVWLLESLIENFNWARDFRQKYARSTRVIADVSEVLDELQSEDEIARRAAEAELPPVPEVEAARRREPSRCSSPSSFDSSRRPHSSHVLG